MQTFEEAQLEAIKKAVASEREKGQRLIDEQKALMKTSLEEERIQCLELIKSSIEEERLKSKVKLNIQTYFYLNSHLDFFISKKSIFALLSLLFCSSVILIIIINHV